MRPQGNARLTCRPACCLPCTEPGGFIQWDDADVERCFTVVVPEGTSAPAMNQLSKRAEINSRTR